MSADQIDVLVIGDGVIGLSIAFELARAGGRCHVFGALNTGMASGAAAGLLAPSIGTLPPNVQPFFDASLALYPEFVEELRAFEPELVLLQGLIDVSSKGKDSVPAGSRLLSARELSELEPQLTPQRAAFHSGDGAVDNGLLIRALRRAVTRAPSCRVTSDDPVLSVEPGLPFKVRTQTGTTIESNTVVLAAGAWSTTIAGLPRELPVVPLKGQMLAVASSAIRHPVMGDDIYLVPRRGEIAIGATVEHAGFDTTVATGAIEELRQSAIRVCPALLEAPVTRTWAGIRPATPDMRPILGADPQYPNLLYACGHSKNGILLAPATAKSLAAVATGNRAPLDIGPFSVERFPMTKKT